ncbi:MAG: hypothetical protein DPW21_06065 [Anaerolineae bacterium]|nr:hypothetical protein [Anaerolineae bacterium]
MSGADKLKKAPQAESAPKDVVSSFAAGESAKDIVWSGKSLTFWDRVVAYEGTTKSGEKVTLYYDLLDGQWLTPNQAEVKFSIVFEGSEWANAGVPVGLEIKQKDNVYYAINAAGQEVEIAKVNSDGQLEYTDALKYKLAATREESINNRIPWEEANKGAANRAGKLIGQPFSEDVVVGKDVVGEKYLKYQLFNWSPEAGLFYMQNPQAIPAKIIGYFTTETEGKIYYGKVVEWKTKSGEIIYLSLINSEGDYQHSNPNGQIFPIGLSTSGIDTVIGRITNNSAINALLKQWINNDDPPADLEDFLLVGKST